MRTWDGKTPLDAGCGLTYNTLWRSGRHELWEFYQVSHVTAKGTIMVHPLGRIKTNTKWDEQQNACGTAKPDMPEEDAEKRRVKKLPLGRLYYLLTEKEVLTGITEEGCCR